MENKMTFWEFRVMVLFAVMKLLRINYQDLFDSYLENPLSKVTKDYVFKPNIL